MLVDGQLRRSANKVYINGDPRLEQKLKDGDRVTIGASTLRFEQSAEESAPTLTMTISRWAIRNC